MKSRFFDFSSKPGLRPDQPDSPGIPAGQKIFPLERGRGVLAIASQNARVVDRKLLVHEIVYYQP
jgi:hypothetical protein